MNRFITDKMAWILVILHAVLFGIGVYQRIGAFHFIYEPIVLQILIILDILWLLVADFLGFGLLSDPLRALLFIGIGGSIQWFFVGYLISKLISRRPRTQAQIKAQQLFQFSATWFSDDRSIPTVIKGDRKWVEQYISLEEFIELFGGCATWRPPDYASEMMQGEGIGVWGKRNISRFRRILRERGAEFEIVDGEGPKQHLWTTS